ncbi:hypothetical protein AB0F17_08380 [Nonomuraea sp. NPDC026600]
MARKSLTVCSKPRARMTIDNHESGSPEDLAIRKRFGLTEQDTT